MSSAARNIINGDNRSSINSGTANSRFLKNCRTKYDEANAMLRSFGQCDRGLDSDLVKIDTAMQLQADALHYAAKVGSMNGADVLEKFDLWMHDYKYSSKDALPPESLTLVTSIFQDLKKFYGNEAGAQTDAA